jgi:adenylate cyclase
MLALGGFINSSAVILWSVFSPFGAILFSQPERAPRWLGAYLGLMLLSALLQPFIARANNLPSKVVIAYFVLNLGVVSTGAFVLVLYFVRGKNEALDLLALEREKSERLLLKVLPTQIALKLKEGQSSSQEHGGNGDLVPGGGEGVNRQ